MEHLIEEILLVLAFLLKAAFILMRVRYMTKINRDPLRALMPVVKEKERVKVPMMDSKNEYLDPEMLKDEKEQHDMIMNLG